MFCSRTSNNRINKLHERALRLSEDEYKELLVLTNELPIHIRNIQTMMKEVYQSPPIMQDIFIIMSNNYNLRNPRELLAVKRNTVKYGTETLTYKASQLWQILATYNIKLSHTLNEFKINIKVWEAKNCPCRRLCKRIYF